jgi:hypothetical protein
LAGEFAAASWAIAQPGWCWAVAAGARPSTKPAAAREKVALEDTRLPAQKLGPGKAPPEASTFRRPIGKRGTSESVGSVSAGGTS